MKKLFTLLLLAGSISVSAQKDSTKDTVIVLTVQQASELIQDIQIQMSGKADIKNEQWTKDLQMIFNAARIRSKADKPKNK